MLDIKVFMESIYHFLRPYTYFILIGALLSVGAGVIIHRDDTKRSESMMRMLYIMSAFLLLSLSVKMASDLQKVFGVFDHNSLIGAVTPAEQTNDPLSKMAGMADVGLGEMMVIGILELIALSFNQVKEWFITDLELKDILFGKVSKVFMNFEVPLDNGSTIDLYDFMLLLVGLVLFLMIVMKAYKIIQEANLDDAEIELRDLFASILETIGKIIIVPVIIWFLVMTNNAITNQFDKIHVESYAAIKTYDPLDYGLGISVAKIYITYLEMKIWLVMLSRNFMLNGILLIGPLAVAVKAMNKEFTSLETWLTMAIKYAFIPSYYGISFVLAVMFINYIPNRTPLTDVFVYSFIFKLVDILISIFAIKGSARDDNKTPGVNILAALMAVRSATQLSTTAIKGGISINKIINPKTPSTPAKRTP